MSPRIHELYIEPAMAFARIGSSENPVCAYDWSVPDMSAGGTGKTTLKPAPSLRFKPDGTLEIFHPDVIAFKTGEAFNPVCPFFELHGVWEIDGEIHQGLMPKDLVAAKDLIWRVSVSNLKPFRLTQDPDTRIEARVCLSGDKLKPAALLAASPSDAAQPLVPKGRTIPLGRVRLSRPSAEVPGYRLRFYPGAGQFFGPPNLRDLWDVDLPEACLFLNERSSWVGWRATQDNPRTSPMGQYAGDENGRSYGLIDDICDGFIECRLRESGLPPALARIVVAPPDYAPDRRPLVSIADGLTDRVRRADAIPSDSPEDMSAVEQRVCEIFEKVAENTGLMNLDALAAFFDAIFNENAADRHGVTYSKETTFTKPSYAKAGTLSLSRHGVARHRRLLNRDLLREYFRERPDLLETFIRGPDDASPIYDRRMPALMRGSDELPLKLTHYQFETLKIWAASLQEPGD